MENRVRIEGPIEFEKESIWRKEERQYLKK